MPRTKEVVINLSNSIDSLNPSDQEDLKFYLTVISYILGGGLPFIADDFGQVKYHLLNSDISDDEIMETIKHYLDDNNYQNTVTIGGKESNESYQTPENKKRVVSIECVKDLEYFEWLLKILVKDLGYPSIEKIKDENGKVKFIEFTMPNSSTINDNRLQEMVNHFIGSYISSVEVNLVELQTSN